MLNSIRIGGTQARDSIREPFGCKPIALPLCPPARSVSYDTFTDTELYPFV
jgi:hypothetical protein